MGLTRRNFIGALSTGTAAATALRLVLPERAAAATEAVSARRPNNSPVRLNSNENAYGPSAQVSQAIRDGLTEAHRYPDAARRDFVEAVSKRHGVSAEQVLVGCGSVEILTVAALAFTDSRKKLVMASPTFEVIGHRAQDLGAQVIRVPLTKDFAHDLSAMLASAGEDAGLIYICNPNNPTASLTPRSELDAFISKLPSQAYVLVDEAYHHFATESKGYESFLDRPSKNERVIVARTFSKAYGLAGMRLGYGISSRGTIERMRRRGGAGEINANIAVLRGALAALEGESALRAAVRRNAADRTEFMKQARLRKLSPIPSYANFAMMDIHQPVVPVIESFKKKGILVGRPFPPLDTYLRVSFGKPEEMNEFWRAWEQLPALAG